VTNLRLAVAEEWKKWLLVYAPALLFKQLPKSAYAMMMYLVTALYMLLGKVTKHLRKKGMCTKKQKPFNFLNFSVAKKYIHRFIGTWPYYHTMNVHVLYHLVPCVKQHGPLWTFWAFPFESTLGHIKTFNHSRKVVEHQMGLSANIMSCRPMLIELASVDYRLLSHGDKKVPSINASGSLAYIFLLHRLLRNCELKKLVNRKAQCGSK